MDITRKYSGVLNSNVLWLAFMIALLFQLLRQNIGPLLNDGLASIGSIFLFLALSISSVVIGVRKLFLLIGLQFFALLLLILLISIDLVVPVPEQGIGYLLSPVTWLFHAVVIAIGAALPFHGSSKLGHWHRESLVNAKDNFLPRNINIVFSAGH